MRSRCVAFSVLGAGLLCAGLAGAPREAAAQSQIQVNADAQADFNRANGALTVVFNHVAQKLPFLTRKKLEAAEKAWAAYRDAQASFSASIEAEGGSLYPTAFNDARTDLTRQRIKLLKKIASNGTP